MTFFIGSRFGYFFFLFFSPPKSPFLLRIHYTGFGFQSPLALSLYMRKSLKRRWRERDIY
jgi:hypothetical protein